MFLYSYYFFSNDAILWSVKIRVFLKVLAFLHYYNGDCDKYLNSIIESAIDGMGDIDIAQCFENDEDNFDPSWWEEQFKQDYLNNK